MNFNWKKAAFAGLLAACAFGWTCFAGEPLEGRTWLLYRPEGQVKGAVVILYGYGGTAEGYCPRMVDAAKRHGFAACIPEALPDDKGKRSWNVGYPSQAKMAVDDTDFMDALATKLRAELGVRHVFLTGMSNGGEMCYQMAYRSPRTFDAIASVSGLTLTALSDRGAPQGNVPFLELHGDADKTSLWEGDLQNENRYWGAYLPVPEAVARLVEKNGGARDEFAERRVTPSVTCRTWAGRCETRLYRVEKGGHSWFFDKFDSGDEICRFFESVTGEAAGRCGQGKRSVVITAHPLANAEVLEPSVQNEVDHALNVASTNAVPPTPAARDFARLYATNGMSATERAISLISSQKDGCWYWQGTNVTPVAVRILRRTAGCPETQGK